MIVGTSREDPLFLNTGTTLEIFRIEGKPQ